MGLVPMGFQEAQRRGRSLTFFLPGWKWSHQERAVEGLLGNKRAQLHSALSPSEASDTEEQYWG